MVKPKKSSYQTRNPLITVVLPSKHATIYSTTDKAMSVTFEKNWFALCCQCNFSPGFWNDKREGCRLLDKFCTNRTRSSQATRSQAERWNYVYSVNSQTTFRRNIFPSSLRSKSDPSNKQRENIWQAEMEAKYFSETSVYFQLTTRRYIPENSTLHDHCCGNLRSYVIVTQLLRLNLTYQLRGLYVFWKENLFEFVALCFEIIYVTYWIRSRVSCKLSLNFYIKVSKWTEAYQSLMKVTCIIRYCIYVRSV
jgi:hypothetical protein